jgi:glycosyl transferase family 25
MFLDAFEAIRILNLPHRADRRAEMKQELRKLGLSDDPRVKFFSGAVLGDPGPFSSAGVHSCYRSHLKLLQSVAATGDRTLVLEDDCSFTAEAAKYELPSEDWDIFYGGYLADEPDDPANSNIIGAHCMGYSPWAAAALAEYLTELLDPDSVADPTAIARGEVDPGLKPPFDGAIVWFRRAHPGAKTVFAQIAEQRSSRSDIAPRALLDRTVPGIASAARKIKNILRRR